MILMFHKPFGVLTQFTPERGAGAVHPTLAGFGLPKSVYPVGRLDRDSEGLLVLTDEGDLPDLLLPPARKHPREYWVQVEGTPGEDALNALRGGVEIKTGKTAPCTARSIEEPDLPPRDPPIRFRKNKPTSWMSLELTEGKNRQVRRMTAAVGHPTLRLVRASMGRLKLGSLERGTFRELDQGERALLLRRQ